MAENAVQRKVDRLPAVTVTTQRLPALREAPTHQLLLPEASPEIIEQAMQLGDIKLMSPQVRVAYYIQTCLSIGLNPYTQPFDLIEGDDGKVKQYPNKSCAEQIRKRDQISLPVVSRVKDGDLYIVTVKATTPNGREEEAQGIVSLVKPVGTWKSAQSGSGKRYFEPTKDADGQAVYEPLRGTELANAYMRAETKAKRRATFGIAGLGFGEDEPQGTPIAMNLATGELGTPETARPPVRLGEAQKTTKDHITDLFGDDPRGSSPSVPVAEQAVVTPEPLPPETPQEDAEGEGHVSGRLETENEPSASQATKTRYARRQALCALVLQSQRSLSEYIRVTAKRCKIEATDPDEVLMAISDGWIDGLIREAEAYLAKHPPQPDPTPTPDEATVSAFTLGAQEDVE